MFAWALGQPLPALALNPALTLAQYHHASWLGSAGAPSEVVATAQTRDGFLWLATATGLVKFDGVAFEKVAFLGGEKIDAVPVMSLAVDDAGGLWIGFAGAHRAAVYRNGRLTYVKGAGLTTSFRPVVVGDETWLLSNYRLVRMTGDGVEKIGATWGYPDHMISSIVSDRHGTLWVFAPDGQRLYYLPRGERTFRLFQSPDLQTEASVDKQGNVWTTGMSGMTVVLTRDGLPIGAKRISHRPTGKITFDRDGGLWAFNETGLIHVGDPSRLLLAPDDAGLVADTLTPTQGLSSTGIWSIQEDREGDIWIGTSAGLDRFRDTRFVPVRLPRRANSFGVASAGNGQVWAGNYNGSLLKVGLDEIQSLDAVDAGIHCLYRDPDGSVWVAGAEAKIWHIGADGSLVTLDLPAEFGGLMIRGMTRDKTGALWVTNGRGGFVVRWLDDRFDRPAGSNGFPAKWGASAAATDGAGRAWLAQTDDIMLIDDGQAHLLGAKALGLDVGEITTLFSRGSRMWVGGTQGVAFYDGTRFHVLKTDPANPLQQVTGVFESAGGDLWLRGYDAVYLVRAAELARALSDPGVVVGLRRFDGLDGLIGTQRYSAPVPSVIEASDGKLWFASNAGLAWTDPRQQPAPPLLPNVLVESVSVDGVAQEAGTSLSLPKLSRNVRIAYTATALAFPERIHFRYRLDGFDPDWREVGTQREALYSTLPPGRYTFRVMATDSDGNWRGEGASLAFSVQPAWYQTWVFRIACGLLAFGVLWAVYWLRIKQVTAQLRLQARTQQEERERIARELHDTLLQSAQGLILIVQAASRYVPPGERAQTMLEQAAAEANAVVAEGRDRIQALRAPTHTGHGLQAALEALEKELGREGDASFDVVVLGAERELDPTIADEAFCIVREAVTNAFRHAEADAVEVQIVYDAVRFQLRVRDNGRGIDPQALETGASPGHWGLPGMRERAQRISGDLEISSRAGVGTEVALSVGAKTAYARYPAVSGWVSRLRAAIRPDRPSREATLE